MECKESGVYGEVVGLRHWRVHLRPASCIDMMQANMLPTVVTAAPGSCLFEGTKGTMGWIVERWLWRLSIARQHQCTTVD